MVDVGQDVDERSEVGVAVVAQAGVDNSGVGLSLTFSRAEEIRKLYVVVIYIVLTLCQQPRQQRPDGRHEPSPPAQGDILGIMTVL